MLFQPQIPPNTGNIIRLCANTGSRLHLIAPLGFELDSARLRRAGLDYHDLAVLAVHEDLGAAREVLTGRWWAFSARAQRRYDQPRYQPGDALVFGPESSGLPAQVLESFPPEQQLRLPMVPGNRSLNLGNAVAVAVYQAWGQLGFPGSS